MASRDESRARMREAERLLTVAGQHPTVVEHHLVETHGISHRQARRYIRAVRRIYAQHASEDALSIDEMLGLLLARADGALAGLEPDHKASIKALELYARLRGWLDRKSTVTVQGDVTITHELQARVDALPPDARLALAQYHEALERARVAGVVDTTAEETEEPEEPGSG